MVVVARIDDRSRIDHWLGRNDDRLRRDDCRSRRAYLHIHAIYFPPEVMHPKARPMASAKHSGEKNTTPAVATNAQSA